jgi:plasmid stability protein
MRTTIDLPDELYRTLKVRAAKSGIPLRGLVQSLIEQGLRLGAGRTIREINRQAPPVIIPSTGKPIKAFSASELKRLEEAEDKSKDARSTRR